VLGQDARNLAIMFAAVGMIGFVTQVFALEPLRQRFKLVQILVLALALAARGCCSCCCQPSRISWPL
jgi:hypothetical protein